MGVVERSRWFPYEMSVYQDQAVVRQETCNTFQLCSLSRSHQLSYQECSDGLSQGGSHSSDTPLGQLTCDYSQETLLSGSLGCSSVSRWLAACSS